MQGAETPRTLGPRLDKVRRARRTNQCCNDLHLTDAGPLIVRTGDHLNERGTIATGEDQRCTRYARNQRGNMVDSATPTPGRNEPTRGDKTAHGSASMCPLSPERRDAAGLPSDDTTRRRASGHRHGHGAPDAEAGTAHHGGDADVAAWAAYPHDTSAITDVEGNSFASVPDDMIVAPMSRVKTWLLVMLFLALLTGSALILHFVVAPVHVERSHLQEVTCFITRAQNFIDYNCDVVSSNRVDGSDCDFVFKPHYWVDFRHPDTNHDVKGDLYAVRGQTTPNLALVAEFLQLYDMGEEVKCYLDNDMGTSHHRDTLLYGLVNTQPSMVLPATLLSVMLVACAAVGSYLALAFKRHGMRLLQDSTPLEEYQMVLSTELQGYHQRAVGGWKALIVPAALMGAMRSIVIIMPIATILTNHTTITTITITEDDGDQLLRRLYRRVVRKSSAPVAERPHRADGARSVVATSPPSSYSNGVHESAIHFALKNGGAAADAQQHPHMADQVDSVYSPPDRNRDSHLLVGGSLNASVSSASNVSLLRWRRPHLLNPFAEPLAGDQ